MGIKNIVPVKVVDAKGQMGTQSTTQQLIPIQNHDQGRLLEETNRVLEVFKKAYYAAEREMHDREARFDSEKRALEDKISQLRQERIYALGYAAGWSTDPIPLPPPNPPPVSSLLSTAPPIPSCIEKAVELQDARDDQGARKNPQSWEVLCNSGIPVWKFVINCPLTKQERMLLITAIFSNCGETEVVMGLGRDDAQSFVDATDETLDALAPQLRSSIRKTVNLLFLLEQAGKAAISGQKHRKQATVKQGAFSQSIMA